MNNKNNNRDYVFTCLHCQDSFIIYSRDFNCKILRHGVYKHNLEPINPHATKEECDALLASGEIYGCAGPLIITKNGDDGDDGDDGGDGGDGDERCEYRIQICGYI